MVIVRVNKISDVMHLDPGTKKPSVINVQCGGGASDSLLYVTLGIQCQGPDPFLRVDVTVRSEPPHVGAGSTG